MASARASSRPCAGLAGLDGEFHDAPLHHAPRTGHGMRAIRGADDDEPRHALRVTLAEGQRHHAAIRRARNGAQRSDAEMIDEPQQDFGLVVRGDRRETARRRAARWSRRSRPGSRNSGCENVACRARARGPRLRATSRRAAHRAARRGARRRCRRSPPPLVRRRAPPAARRWTPTRARHRNAA